MSMTLSAAPAQSTPQDPAALPTTVAPAAGAQPATTGQDTATSAAPAEPPAATVLFDQVMARLASLASSTDDADAGASGPAARPADSETAVIDDSQHDTDLPAMAAPVMPLLMNFPLAAPLAPAAASVPAPSAIATADDQDAPPAVAAVDSGTAPARADLAANDTIASAPVAPPAPDNTPAQPAAPAPGDARASSAAQRALPLQADQSDAPTPVAATYASAHAAAGGDQAEAKNTVAGTAPAGPATSLWASATNTATSPPAESVKLAGAPAQWKQPLRDALGERLQMQVGSNSEQAVIRLDPPELGRIDIAIRREAGALQVNVSASNNEVLQQLRGIGESMRLDLAHRQNSDVSVTISAAPRNQSASTDADGRQRQPGAAPDQDERIPSRALADADLTSSHFAPLARGE